MDPEKVVILVCEDDPDHRLLMMEALEDNLSDAEFLEAESGAECLEILRKQQPEVLILDYRLGDMDGIELLEIARRELSETAVLLVTSQGDEKIAVEAMKKGARDYVVKDTRMVFIDHLPISVNQALKQIRTDREKAHAQDQLKASEILNRTILDQMMEAVIYVDGENRIIKHNNLAVTLLEIHDEFENLQLITDDKFHRFLPGIKDWISKLQSQPDLPVIDDEITVNSKIISIRLSPVRSMDREYQGMIINLSDITRLRQAEQERVRAVYRAVSALAKAVEFRDPYTAGHATNVMIIATRIAQELGWDEDRIEGLRLACELHDVGKIAIPAEILTRPTALTPLERAMLREHPEKGYAILKDIRFPYPVAEAVYQHHEVLDGSGYPRRLIDVEVIPEARIICVADVLDAITSHRPYRPGLGMDKAVEQLKSGRNRLYDAQVVDVILRLIKKARGQSFWMARTAPLDVMSRELRTDTAWNPPPAEV